MAETVSVWVSVTVDMEEARRAGMLMSASNFLAQFRAQGEDWRREVLADPLLETILRVEISTR